MKYQVKLLFNEVAEGFHQVADFAAAVAAALAHEAQSDFARAEVYIENRKYARPLWAREAGK